MKRLTIGAALAAVGIGAAAAWFGSAADAAIRLRVPDEIALYSGRAPEPVRLESTVGAPVVIESIECEPAWLGAGLAVGEVAGAELPATLPPRASGLLQLRAVTPPEAPGRATARVELVCDGRRETTTLPLRVRTGLTVTPQRLHLGVPRSGQAVTFACTVRCAHASSLRVRVTGADVERAAAYRIPAASGPRRWVVRGALRPLPGRTPDEPVRVWIESVDSDAANYVEIDLGASAASWVAREDLQAMPFTGFFFGLAPMSIAREIGVHLALSAAAFRAGGQVDLRGLGALRSRLRWRVEPIDDRSCRLVLTVPPEGPAGVFSGRVELRGPAPHQRASFPVSVARGVPGRDFPVVPVAAAGPDGRR